jgi:acetolactate synthase-1/2/3 large subunit
VGLAPQLHLLSCLFPRVMRPEGSICLRDTGVGEACYMEPTTALYNSEVYGRAGELRSGAQILCDALLDHQVDTLFGYCGGAILPFYDALHQTPALRHVMVRHEQAAAHAAAGYARVTGRPGVCVATSGPGATNLLTGMMDAQLDSTPMVVLAGQVATPLIGLDAFQETDMMSMTSSITKHNYQPRTVIELYDMIHCAFHLASTGRQGVVYIDLPVDVMKATTTHRARHTALHPGYDPEPTLPMSSLKRAAAAIRDSERPLLLLGGGVVSGNAEVYAQSLAEQLNIPVATTIMAKGAISEHHPQNLGVVGMYGLRSAQWAMMHCDTLVAIGSRFSDRVTGDTRQFARGKQIIHIDIDAYEPGKNVTTAVPIQADALQAVQALLSLTVGYQPNLAQKSWSEQCAVGRQICTKCVPHQAAMGIHPKHVMDALNAAKSSEDVITTGVGQHQMYASHFLKFDRSRTFVSSLGAGTMGFGLAAAMGVAKAKPDVTVFLIDGDGSFQMMCQELSTVAQEDLHIVMLVLDNTNLGMVRQWQDRVYEGRRSATLFTEQPGHPDFTTLAAAYGIPAESVREVGELEAALKTAQARRGPSLIRIEVDPEDDLLPMMPAGGTLADFYGNCVPSPGVLFNAEERRTMALPIVHGGKE